MKEAGENLIVFLIILVIFVFVLFIPSTFDLTALKTEQYPDAVLIPVDSPRGMYILNDSFWEDIRVSTDIRNRFQGASFTMYGINNTLPEDIISWYLTVNENHGWVLFSINRL